MSSARRRTGTGQAERRSATAPPAAARAAREVREVREVRIGRVTIGGARRPIAIIAGPDVMEDASDAVEIARALATMCERAGLPFVFKASYDKGNRGEASSYRGPMLDEGLAILDRVRREVGCPVLTDVHSEDEARRAGEVVDIVQLPAYLCMQTALTLAIGRTGRAVNVKKGQFLSPRAVEGIARKIESTGNERILVTERGTTFGYSDLVADFRNLPLIRSLGYPVVLDPTHIIRYPGIPSSDPAGGEPEYVPHLCRAAAAAGCDALFIETHPEPRRARCDAASMLRLEYVPELLEQVAAIDRVAKSFDLGVRARDSFGFV
jgi:2-dehydro-3-deoxyphosphooctonate aldolase (KDO 8-P synthase)